MANFSIGSTPERWYRSIIDVSIASLNATTVDGKSTLLNCSQLMHFRLAGWH